jgi:hypothetical protein
VDLQCLHPRPESTNRPRHVRLLYTSPPLNSAYYSYDSTFLSRRVCELTSVCHPLSPYNTVKLCSPLKCLEIMTHGGCSCSAVPDFKKSMFTKSCDDLEMSLVLKEAKFLSMSFPRLMFLKVGLLFRHKCWCLRTSNISH